MGLEGKRNTDDIAGLYGFRCIEHDGSRVGVVEVRCKHDAWNITLNMQMLRLRGVYQ
jgi:hypothetical protein